MVANPVINRHSIFKEQKIKMKCQKLYELPLAFAMWKFTYVLCEIFVILVFKYFYQKDHKGMHNVHNCFE